MVHMCKRIISPGIFSIFSIFPKSVRTAFGQSDCRILESPIVDAEGRYEVGRHPQNCQIDLDISNVYVEAHSCMPRVLQNESAMSEEILEVFIRWIF